MVFTINNNIFFIGSMQFINPSLNNLQFRYDYSLEQLQFRYLSEKFNGDLLELVKQKGFYPYEYMDSSEKF